MQFISHYTHVSNLITTYYTLNSAKNKKSVDKEVSMINTGIQIEYRLIK